MKVQDAFALGEVKGNTIDNMEAELNQIKTAGGGATSAAPPDRDSNAGLMNPSVVNNDNNGMLPPLVMPPSGPSAAALPPAAAANEFRDEPANAIHFSAVGPNRSGTVHIEELPVPARDGDDDMPEAPE